MTSITRILHTAVGVCLLSPLPVLTLPAAAADWMDLPLRSGAKAVYVSAGGSDASDGLSPATAKRTIGAAYALVTDGAGDHLLLRRGDTFTLTTTILWNKSGFSAEFPTVLGAYGTGPRPIVDPGTSVDGSGRVTSRIGIMVTALQAPRPPVRHVAIVGLHMYASARDWTRPGFSLRQEDHIAGSAGIFSNTGGIGPNLPTIDGLLIEDCLFEYLGGGVSLVGPASDTIRNVVLNRNVFKDLYVIGHTNAVYASDTTGLTITENVIDGVMQTAHRAGLGGVQDSSLAHAFYIQTTSRDVAIANNLITNAFDGGMMRPGGPYHHNVVVAPQIGSHHGYVFSGTQTEFLPDGVVSSVMGNVFLRPTLYGAQLGNIRSGVVEDNVTLSVPASNAPGIHLIGQTNDTQIGVHDLTIQRNFHHGVEGVRSFGAVFRGVAVRDNTFRSQNLVIAHLNYSPANFTHANNAYCSGGASPRWFNASNATHDLASWRTLSGEQTAQLAAPCTLTNLPDIAGYEASLGGSDGEAGFWRRAREQSRGTWDDRYTAEAVIAYVRQQLNLPPLSTVPPLPPTIEPIADRTIAVDGVLAPIAVTLHDTDTPLDALTVTALSSNSALVPNATANLNIAGTGGTRLLTVTLAQGQTGTTTITLTVTDNELSTTESFLLTVTPASSAPTYLLAEGSTGAFFDTDVLIANPNAEATPVSLRFLKEGGEVVTRETELAPMSRTTIRVDNIAGLEAAAGVSTVVTSPSGRPLIVERTMRWDASGYGAHTDRASAGMSTQWYFAEGAQGFFSTFLSLVNPQTTANTARVTFLRGAEPPIEREYALAPQSRFTADAGADPDLVGREFGARVDFAQPAMAERAMYFGASPFWTGGHASAGAVAPWTEWFLAEGATGSYFTTFVLLANPGLVDAAATVTFLPADGAPVSVRLIVPAGQRVTRNIADADPTLRSAAVATHVVADRPIVVERAQYWPGGPDAWQEAHNSFGVTATATRWGLAEGRQEQDGAYQTYILLANLGTATADVTITFLRTTRAPIVKTFSVPAARRFNVQVTGAGSDVPELVDEEFGAIIESSQPLAVERSMYANVNGITWAAGTNATAARLP